MSMTEEEKNALDNKVKEQENELDKKAIRVVSSSNDTFKEHYKIPELGLEFDIKLKVPTLIDNAKISARLERYFEGTASFMSDQTIAGYRMLAVIEHQINKYGDEPEMIEVPEFLRDGDKVYNLYPLIVISKDFNAFLDTFQY